MPTIPHTFATYPAGNFPASDWDANWSFVGLQSNLYCTTGGTVGAMVLTPASTVIAVPAYQTGMKFTFLSLGINLGATTIKVGSLAAMTCYTTRGVAFTGGEIPGSGIYCEAIFDQALNSNAGGFRVQVGVSNPASGAVMLVNQALIDASPDGTIITVAAGATISAITITSKALHFILLPGSPILVTGTITMESNLATTWAGYGSAFGGGTRLKWQGNNTDFCFTLSRCQYCEFEGFSITADPADHPLNVAFALMSTNTGQVMTQCHFEDIKCNGTAAGGLKYGWRIGVQGVVNGDNNDLHTFKQCVVTNHDTCGWSIEQPEAKGMSFIDCASVGNSIAHYGISTGLNGGLGGSFVVNGFNGGGHTTADFLLGEPDDFISIANIDLESSNRVLDCVAQSGSPWPLYVGKGRIATDLLNADGNVMRYTHRGPFIVEDLLISNDNNRNVQITIDATGRCQGIAIGNNITSNLDQPFTTTNTANGRWLMLGNNLGIGTGGVISNPVAMGETFSVLTLSEIPTAIANAPRGQHLLITDCVSPVIGDSAVGSGANTALLMADGGASAWRIIASALPNGKLPATQTNNYSQAPEDTSLVFNGGASITLTLLAAATYPNRRLWVKTIAAFTVVSASSNVRPVDSATPGTAILPATAGAWALLQSDGTNWVIMQSGTVGGGAVGANPTASVGLTPVNGAAATFLRSDGAPQLDQSILPTWTGQHIWSQATTIASATGASLDDHKVAAATTTITGNTGSPITRLAKSGFYRPTLTDASAVTVTDAATVYIDNSPLAAGSVTISNAWSLLVGSGSTKLQATTINAALTYGGVTLSNSVVGTGSMVLATTPTFTTNITTPLVIGGTTASSTLTLESTSGAGTTDSIIFKTGSQSTRMTIASGGNTGIGTETNPQFPLVASGNASTGITSGTGTALLIVAADNVGTLLSVDNYATAPTAGLSTRLVGGTFASQSDTPASSTFDIQLLGRANGAIIAASAAKITMSTISAWSATDTSTLIDFFTTPVASTTRARAARIQGSGGVSIGATTDPASGGLLLNGQFYMANITQTSAAQTGTVCWITGSTPAGKFTVDTTVGCLTSVEEAKNIIAPLLPADALGLVTRMEPFSFRYRPGFGDEGEYEQFGLGARQIAAIDERMVGRDIEGNLRGVRYMELTAVLAGAIKQLKHENDELRAQIAKLTQ